jgi:HK97 family phage prohead protease
MPQVIATYETSAFVITSEGEFEGRALTFEDKDVNYGLTYAPDAFDEAIKEKGVAGIKMLREHDPACLVGVWHEISRDDKGLWVRGKLVLETEDGRDTLALMKAGALDGLSVAFMIQAQEGTKVTKADLFEISIVAFPASPGANVGLGDDGEVPKIRVYKSNGELPKRVRSMLPPAAQTIYRQAHNRYARTNPNATLARAQVVAWRAVTKHFSPQSKEAAMWVQKLNHDSAVNMADEVMLDGIRRTADGYLAAEVKVARTGIQLYRGYECGRPEMDVVRVYRSDAEVFDDAAMRSFAHRPVTIDHPQEMVNADNWKDYAVGQTGDEVKQEGKYLRVPMVLMDAEAIREVEAGKRQLSMGYTTDLKWQDGVTPDGEKYDAIQTGIRGNHLAVVARARGGSGLRIGDDNHGNNGGAPMPKTMVIDELEIQLADDASEKILKRYLAKIENDVVTLKKKLGASPAEGESKGDFMARCQDAGNDADACSTAWGKKSAGDEAMAAKDAEMATVKKQLSDAEAKTTPEALDALAKDRGDLIAQATKMIGDKLATTGKTSAEIRRQVVDAFMGDLSKEWSDSQVETSFATLAAKDSKAPEPKGGTRHLADALKTQEPRKDVQAIRDEAHSKYVARTKDAWKSAPRAQA